MRAKEAGKIPQSGEPLRRTRKEPEIEPLPLEEPLEEEEPGASPLKIDERSEQRPGITVIMV